MITLAPFTAVLLIIGICATFGPSGSILYGLLPFTVALVNEILRVIASVRTPDDDSVRP